jgi:signal transduction histidine kinase
MPPFDLLLSLLVAIGIAFLLASIIMRRVRSRVASLERELDAARSREAALRASDRAKDEFIAMLGHELRNPLGALAAVSHILRKVGENDPAVLNAAEVLGRQVQHMSRCSRIFST